MEKVGESESTDASESENLLPGLPKLQNLQKPETSSAKVRTMKVLNIQTPKKLDVIIQKLEQCWFY